LQSQTNSLSVSRVLKNRLSKILAVFLIYMIGGFPTLVFALPQDGQIVSGQGTIGQPNQNQMVINQNSNQLITNWDSFSIGQSEHVQFNQPNSNSTALNRVTGQDPSAIMGRLSANGQVFLSNSSGIIFGKNSRVNVGGLMATTLGISNEDFLNRNYHFKQDESKPLAAILSQGIIEAGQVGLLAPRVENQGTIIANLGNVALSSGEAAILDFDGSGLINFQITEPVNGEVKDADGNVVESGVVNSGFVKAHSGNVILSASQARGMVRSVVNNTGIIEANNVVKKGGRVFLMGNRVKNSGTINVTGTESGQTGGTVHILGNEVNISGGTIDASGDAGGGTILIGGDKQGQNPNIQNAQNTIVAESATIKADAINKGDGGKVIIWAENSTKVYAAISARGGANGGDGGFVETSGKKFLDVTKAADVSAPKGKAGTWLLDPTNIEIVSGPGNGDGSQVSVTTIETALNAGTSVHIVTSGQGLEEGNITVSTAILKSSGGNTSLTLTAHGDIIVNQSITSTNGTLDVNLIAGADILINASIATNGGNLLADAGATNLPANISGSYTPAARISGAAVELPKIEVKADITTGGGDVTLGQFKTKSHSLIGGGTYTKENVAKADILIENASISTGGGDFKTNGANVNLNQTVSINSDVGNISLDSNIGTPSLTLSANQGLNANILLNSTPSINISSNSSLTSQGGDITISSNAAELIIVEQPVLTINIEDDAAITTEGGNILIDGGDNSVVLVAGDLSVANPNGVGGTIQVLGTYVGIMGDAELDASGDEGGGTILVGGDFQGSNEEIRNAERAFIAANASLKADALRIGNGGKIIAWADGITRFYGNISATGGSTSGDGGFVEVSGKDYLDFNGLVDLSAVAGSAGNLLLDPRNLTIVNGGSETDLVGATGDDSNANIYAFAEDSSLDVTIDASVINALLSAGTTVTLQAHNDITISEAIDGTGGIGGLFLQAGDDVHLNANITTGNGVINITANHGSATSTGSGTDELTGDITVGSDTIVLDAGTAVITLSAEGNIDLPRLTTTSALDAAINVTSTAGDITDGYNGDDLVATSGGAVLSAATGIGSSNAIDTSLVKINLTNSTSGNISILEGSSAGSLEITGITTGGTTGTTTVKTRDTAGDLTISGNLNTVGTTILQSARDITLNASNNITMATNGSLVMQAGNTVTLNSSITASGTGTLHFEGDSGHTDAGAANGVGNLILASSQTFATANQQITLIFASGGFAGTTVNAGSGAINVAESQTGQTLSLGSGGELTNAFFDTLNTTGTLTIGQATTAGSDGVGTGATALTASAVTANAITSTTVSTFSIQSGSTVTFQTGASTFSGNLTVNATGAIAINVGATSDGAVSMTSTGGAFSVASGIQLIAENNGGAGGLTVSATSVTLNGGASGTENLENAGSGGVSVTASSGDITLGNGATAFAIRSNAGDVTLNASGNIVTVASADFEIFSDGNVTFTGNNIGLTNAIEIAGTGNGNKTLTLTVNGSGSTANVTLYNPGAGQDDLFNAINVHVTQANSAVNLDLVGAESVTGASGTNHDLNATLNTNNISLTYTLSQASQILRIGSIDAGTGNVTLSSAGQILDTAGAETTTDITANTLTLTSSGSIGVDIGDAINTDVASLVITSTGGSGSAFITETDALTLGTISVGTGSFQVSGGGTLTVSTAITTTGSGNITLDSSDRIDVNANLTAGGALSLDGDSNNAAGTNDDILIASGLTLTANGGAITLDAFSAASDNILAEGALTLNATNGITINHDLIGTSSGGAITINADTDGATVAGGLFSLASGQTINAQNNALSITSDTITLTGTLQGSGALTLQTMATATTIGLGGGAGTFNLDDTEIGNLTNGFSSITIGASSGTGLTNIDTATFNDAITIRGGNMNLTTSGTAAINMATATDSVTLESTGTIHDADTDNTSIDINAASATVTLTSSGIIASSTSDTLNIDAGTLVILSTGNGTVFITEEGGANIGTMNAGAGNITISTNGSFLSSSSAITAANLTITTTGSGASLGATGAGALNTTLSGTLTATASTGTGGGIFINNTGSLALGVINAGSTSGDTVELTATAGMTNSSSSITAENLTLTVSDDGAAIGASGTSNDINITLAGTLTASAATGTGGIFVAATGNMLVGAINASTSGNIELRAEGGAFTSTDTLAITGATVTIEAATNIDINENITSSGALTINADSDNNGSGDFTLAATTALNSSGNALSITGNTFTLTAADSTLNSGAGNMFLLQSSDTTISVGSTSGNFDVDDAEILAITVTSGTLTIGDSSVNGEITLQTAAFGATNVALQTNTTIRDSDDLGSNLTTTGTLTLTSGGTIGGSTTQGLNIDVTSVTVSASGGNDVILRDNGTTATTLTITTGGAGDVEFVKSGAGNLVIGGVSTTGNITNIEAANGTITQTGALTVTGTASFDTMSASNTITLTNASNAVQGAISFTTIGAGSNVTFDNNTTGVIMGTSDITGNLSVTTGGTITDTGTTTVSGTASFITDVANRAITLDSANAITGAITFTSAGGSTTSNVIFDNGTTNLILAGTTIRGTLAATSGGTITQSGALTVDSTSSFTTDVAAQSITLDNTSNVFTGAVSLSTTGASNATLTNNTALDLGTIGIGTGALTISANGAITDTGVTTVASGGTASFTTSGNDQTITLNSTNAIAGAVSFTTSTAGGNTANVTLDNGSTAINLGTLSIAGSFSGTTTGAITTSGTTTTATGLTLTADTGITFTNNVSATGAVVIDADNDGDGTGNFVMESSSNLTSNGNNISITASDFLINNSSGGTITATGATVTVLQSNAGSIGLDGANPTTVASTICGTCAMTLAGDEIAAISATNLVIGDATNDNITVDGITAANSNSITGTVTLNATQAGKTVTFSGTASTFNAVTAVSDGAIGVDAALTTDTGVISLTSNSNSVTTTQDIISAAGLVLNADTGITLSANATAGGAVAIDADVDNGGTDAFTINSSKTLSTATANATINITAGNINIDSGAIAAGSGNVTIAPSSGVSIGVGSGAGTFSLSDAEIDNITTTGTLAIGNSGLASVLTFNDVTAGSKNISLLTSSTIDDTDADATNLTTTGTLSLTSGAAIGGISVLGIDVASVTVTGSGGNNVSITDQGTSDTTYDITTGGAGNISVTQTASNMILAGLSTTGTFTANAVVGSISETGTLTVGGQANFNAQAASQSITLDTNTHALTGTIVFNTNSSGNVRLDNGTNAISFGTSSIGGTLTATTGGTISQSGALTVTGTSSFTTDVNDQAITLNNTSNALTGAVTFTTQTAGGSTGNVVIDNGTTNLILAASTVRGDLTATSGGTITQSGALTVDDVSSFTTDVANQSITLSNTSNALAGNINLSTTGSGDATLDNGTTAVFLNTVNIGQNLAVTAGNAIVDVGSAVITVGGTASFTIDVSTASDILLDNATNAITGAVSFSTISSSSDATLNNGSTILNLGTITVGGSFTGTTTSSIATTTDISTSGGITLNANTGITLSHNVTTGGAVAIDADVDNMNDDGDFTINTSAALSSTGNTISITANDIDLTNGAATAINSGAAATTLLISDSGTIGLGATTGNWTLDGSELEKITATGLNIGDNNDGAITVNGITAANSNNISGTLSLTSGSSAQFTSGDSTFNALNVSAVSGILMTRNVTTDTGGITFNADSNADGTGDLNISSTRALNSSGNAIQITSNDILLSGTINSGAGATTLLASDNGTIGLENGAAAATTVSTICGGSCGMTISGSELLNITATGLNIGNSSGGNITVNGITAANSDNVSGTLSLASGGTIIFSSNSSTFNALTALGAGLVQTDATLTTDTGAVSLTSSGNNVTINQAVTSAGDLTLETTSGIFDVHILAALASSGNVVITGADDVNFSTTSADLTVTGSGTTMITANNVNGSTDSIGNITMVSGSSIDGGSGAITLKAEGTTAQSMTLYAVTTTGTINISSSDGVTVNDNISASGAVTIDADQDTDATGTLTINAAVSTSNSAISYTAAAIALDSGSSNSGSANTTIETSTVVSIGLGAGSGTFSLNDTEIDNITTTGTLIVGNSSFASDIEFDNVTAGSKNLSLLTSSTINDADADATNLTTTGTLSLTSGMAIGGTSVLGIDVASVTVTSSGGNNVSITDQGTSDTTFNITTGGAGTVTLIQSANNMILGASTTSGQLTATGATSISTSGSISTGALTLSSIIGVTLNNNVTAGGAVVIDPDTNNTGSGTFTIASGQTLSTAAANATISITGVSFVLDGSIASGSGNITITPSQAGTSIGLGSGSGTISITDAQLDRISTTGTLTIGDATNTTTVTVDGVTNSTASTFSIIGNDTGGTGITFSGTASTFNALTLSNPGSININTNVTTAGTTTITADNEPNSSGDLQIANGVTLATGGNALNIIADDIVMNTSGAINTGAGSITIKHSNNGLINLGATDSADLTIDGTELQNITTTGGLTFGDSSHGNMIIDGISANNSNNISGTLTLNTGGNVTFNNGASTFNALTVSATNEIVNNVAVTTDTGDLSLTSTGTNFDVFIQGALTSAGATTISAAEAIIFSAAGSITGTGSGAVSLTANNDNLDGDNNPAAGDTISMDASSFINAGSGKITLDASGAFADAMVLDLITTTSTDANAITITSLLGVTLNDNVTVSGGVSINADSDADGNSGNVDFTLASGAALTTNGGALSITANDVDISGTINTGAGATTFLVSDSGTIGLENGAATGATQSTICGGTCGMTISGSELLNITSTGLTIGDNTGGNITVNGISAANSNNISGTLTLNTGGSASFDTADSTFNALAVNAVNGITLNRNVTTDTGSATFDSDSNADGTGDFTIAASQTLTTNNNTAAITANDIILNGSINAGASGNVTLNISDSGTLGLENGAAAANTVSTICGGACGMTISGAELLNITTNTMTIGDTNDGAVTIDGIAEANSNNIATTLLINSGGLATVSSASTFNVISIDAIGGITIGGDLISDSGDISLDANTGTFTSSAALQATGGSSNVTITADNVDLQAGSSFTGSDTFTLQASTAGRSIGIDGGTGDLNLDATEFGFVTAAGFSSVVIGASGATGSVGFSPTSISKNLTIRGAAITLAALNVTGSFTLDVNGGGSITVTDAIVATTGITFTADDDILFTTTNSDLTTTTGGISLTADTNSDATGAITLVDGVIIDGGSGDIALSAAQDIKLGRLVTTSSSDTAVVLTSTSGSIIDNGDLGSPDITATTGRLVIDAVTGIGSDGTKDAAAADDAIDTEVASYDIDNTTSGNVNLVETGGVDLIKVAHAGTGNIVITAGGDVTNPDNATITSGTATVDGNVVDDSTAVAADPVVEETVVVETVVVETVVEETVVVTEPPADAPPGLPPIPVEALGGQTVEEVVSNLNTATQSSFVTSFGDNGGSTGGGC
jgi:hypothetical protein